MMNIDGIVEKIRKYLETHQKGHSYSIFITQGIESEIVFEEVVKDFVARNKPTEVKK